MRGIKKYGINFSSRFWRNEVGGSIGKYWPEVDFEIVPAILGDNAPLWGGVAIASMTDKS